MVRNYGVEEPLFVILITFLVLAWISCLLRAWVKLVMARNITTDDYLMLCGIFFYTGYSASALYGVTHGVGTQGEGMNLEEASVGLRAWWLCEMLYAPVTLSVRTSVAVFLLQIAVQRVHRRIIVAVMVIFWVVTIPLFFIAVFQCRPVSYFWMQPFPTEPRGTCMDGHVIFIVSIVHSVTSACCDWMLGILPIFMLWKIRLNVKTKLTLSILLSMGIFAGIALIVRVVYVRPFEVSVNFLYETLDVANWSILEPSICIIAGCLATLRPIFSCCGWTSGSRSSRRTPARYRQTRSQNPSRSKNSRSINNPLNPVILNSHNEFFSTSWRTHGLLRSPIATKNEIISDYEIMVNMEKGKGKGMFADVIYGTDGRAEKRLSKHEESDGADAEENFASLAVDQANVRHSLASNASVNSGQSIRFSSISSLTTPFRSLQNSNRLSQWHDSPALSQPLMFQGPSSPIQLSPLAPNSPPPPPPVSPSPCHILVKKSTMIGFENSPKSKTASAIHSLPTGAIVPNIPELPRGATMSLIATDASLQNDTFRGEHEHTVNISGPSPKL